MLAAGIGIFYNASLPSFEFEGTIESARVIHSSSHHYSA